MEQIMGLLLESIVNAFVVLIFGFIIAKLVSIVVHSSGKEETILDEKIRGEEVKVDKGLKVKRTKSKAKRVKFVDDIAVRKIDHFEGSEEPIKDFQSCEKVEILDKSPEAVHGFEDERKDNESELTTSGESLKVVDDILVRNIDHFEGTEEPIKDFQLFERISEKVEILDKSLEAVHRFETEAKDGESELMTFCERLVDESDDESTLKEVKGDDYEGVKVSKDVRLLDEALDREAVEEKNEDAKFGEFCSANNEDLAASGLEDVVVGEEMKTEGNRDDNELLLFNDGSDQSGVGNGEGLAVNTDFSDTDLEREAVEERSENTVIDADKVYESSIQMPSGGLEDWIAGMKVKSEMKIAGDDTPTSQNKERGVVSVKEDDVIRTEGIHDGNEELILTNYRNDQNGATTGERLAANAEFPDKESERETVEERDEDTAVDADKVHESSIEMLSGGLEDLDVGVKVKSEVELGSDYIAISQNEEGRVVSVKEEDVIETVEGMSKGNEEEKGILRDENIGGNIAVVVDDDDDDDDWEGIERSELEKVFAEAVNYVECRGKTKDEQLMSLGSDVQMQLFGLHKLALEGPCHEPQPMALKVSARAKWNAWRKLGSMNPEVAMEEYIKLLSDKHPSWVQHSSAGDYKHGSLETEVCGSSDSKPSSLQYPQDNFEVGMMKNENAD